MPAIAAAAHRFFRRGDDQGRSLVDYGGVWLLEFLELSKCRIKMVETEQNRGLKFFAVGSGTMSHVCLSGCKQSAV
ncbi:MAG: hypothetical protein RKO25_01025 [Candidatus Contendobacter sp.]|nr:hypothetical protein [Candidatus Contendobacter sp.]